MAELCRSCSTSLVWARGAGSRWIPLQPADGPVDDAGARFVLRELDATKPRAELLPDNVAAAEPIYVLHFDHCSDPAQWRDAKRRAERAYGRPL